MRRSFSTTREPALFDLPLVVDPEIAEEAGLEVDRTAERDPRPPIAEAEQIDLPAAAPVAAEEDASEGLAERLSAGLLPQRLLAGAIDSAVCGVALGVLVAGASMLGAPPRAVDGPAYLLALLLFSFFYVVFSLVFWGRTPGMLRAGLAARSRRGRPLSPSQAALRWLGGVATVALLGLPTLLALHDRRSLADYLSRSQLAI